MLDDDVGVVELGGACGVAAFVVKHGDGGLVEDFVTPGAGAVAEVDVLELDGVKGFVEAADVDEEGAPGHHAGGDAELDFAADAEARVTGGIAPTDELDAAVRETAPPAHWMTAGSSAKTSFGTTMATVGSESRAARSLESQRGSPTVMSLSRKTRTGIRRGRFPGFARCWPRGCGVLEEGEVAAGAAAGALGPAHDLFGVVGGTVVDQREVPAGVAGGEKTLETPPGVLGLIEGEDDDGNHKSP